jgi:hypothetical protein
MLTIRDAKKVFSKSVRMFRGVFEKHRENRFQSNFHVIQPPQLPFSNIHLVQGINRTLVRSLLKNFISAQEMHSQIIVATAPNACDYLGPLGEKRTIFIARTITLNGRVCRRI